MDDWSGSDTRQSDRNNNNLIGGAVMCDNNCSSNANSPKSNTNNKDLNRSKASSKVSLISQCSQRASKCDTESTWTCPSTNNPNHSTRNCYKRKREDKSDLNSSNYGGHNNEDDSCDDEDFIDIPPEFARDDIEIVVDMYIWFEKVRSFLLGLLC